ncbi:peroxidase-related enzyme [Patulibacter sp. NPDC049589]|uniref:peroxidase-related enzyme n=1 Tax=Patulibacter sp. NPDC049589 TaxID=3154731 RepID=UPI00342EC913
MSTTPVITPVSRLTVPPIDELDSQVLRTHFRQQEQTEGHTSNWFRALSLNAGDLERLLGYLGPLLAPDGGSARLPLREREVIATVVSGDNRCAYCHTNHANKLGRVLGDHSVAHRVAIDHRHVDELTPRERALGDLAVAVNRDPQSITDETYETLRSVHGLDDHEILEALSVAAFIGATNRLGVALAVPPNPEYTGTPEATR